MIAATLDRYGPPDAFVVREVPDVQPGPGELLVEVTASPVTAGDRRLRTADFPGMTWLPGLLMLGVTGPRQRVQGSMFAGRVVAVGADVTRFSAGDRVFGESGAGAYAERLVVSAEGAVARIPDGVTDAEAAATPYGAGTALHFLRDVAEVQPGQRVLIVGASGGVGRLAIQVAKDLGAHVTAVCGAASHDLVRSLGADEVVDHARTPVPPPGATFDVVFDVAGVTTFRGVRRALTPQGRWVTLLVSVGAIAHALWTAWRGGRRAHVGVALGDRASLEALSDLLAGKAIRPVVGPTFPLERIADAHRAAERAHACVVVTPSTSAMG